MDSSRGGFSNKFGFIMAAAGSAVGLGNVWKFPFEVSRGGGAVFVLIYLAFCFLLCFPIMVSEIALGRKTNRNAVGAFLQMPTPRNWSIVGKLGVFSSVLVLSFYSVVAGWTLVYAWHMLMGNFAAGNDFAYIISDWKISGVCSIGFMLATMFIVVKGVSGGIEKASKIMMPTLLFLILALAAYALTLPGATKGVAYYLVPDFSEVKLSTLYGAMGQAFFSLSLGMGTMITYGSYIGKRDNIPSSAVLITISDLTVAVTAGLMMFALIFSQNLQGTSGGPGLIFAVLPGAFGSLGEMTGRIIGFSFFLLLAFAALTSTVSLLEVPVAYVVDEFKMRRNKAVLLVAGVITLLGIPSILSNGASEYFTHFITYFGQDNAVSFMDFITNISSDTLLPVVGLLMSVYSAYVWRTKNLMEELEQGAPGFTNTLVARYVDIALRYICPLSLGIISVFTIADKFFGVALF